MIRIRSGAAALTALGAVLADMLADCREVARPVPAADLAAYVARLIDRRHGRTGGVR